MHDFILEVIGVIALAIAFLLGLRLGMRRRARLHQAALLVAKDAPYKVQHPDPTYGAPVYGPVVPKSDLGPYKPSFFKLDVVKQGVIELHNSWRQKWHGGH